MVEETLKIANEDIEQAFAEVLTAYYQKVESSDVPNYLKLNAIKDRIKENRNINTCENEITRENLFNLES